MPHAFATGRPLGRPVRTAGEPVWAARGAAEHPARAQHRTLINTAFRGREVPSCGSTAPAAWTSGRMYRGPGRAGAYRWAWTGGRVQGGLDGRARTGGPGRAGALLAGARHLVTERGRRLGPTGLRPADLSPITAERAHRRRGPRRRHGRAHGWAGGGGPGVAGDPGPGPPGRPAADLHSGRPAGCFRSERLSGLVRTHAAESVRRSAATCPGGGPAQAARGFSTRGSTLPSSMAPRPWTAHSSGRSAMCTGMPIA